MDVVTASFGRRLRVVRLRAGLTQAEVSERAGVSVRTLRDIERNRIARPRMASLRRLAGAVGLDPETVLGRVGVEVAVLGPLRVRVDEQVVVAGTQKQRYLLGLLALHAGHPVTHEEIIDVLWDDRPPVSCRSVMHTYVSRLRSRLHPDVLVAERGGYRLAVEKIQLDLADFDDLARRAGQARSREPAEALHLWERALSCWQGPVLRDLSSRLHQHPLAEAARQRRLAVVLAHAGLAGRYDAWERAIQQLRAVAYEEPLHERVHAQLMLALAGGGQQAAALSVFTLIRRRLREELGVEPGAQLREAHRRILAGGSFLFVADRSGDQLAELAVSLK
jgi:DNA-binding SARP family transcriptional activator/DNA-binding XRE family transcriptional regulator